MVLQLTARSCALNLKRNCKSLGPIRTFHSSLAKRQQQQQQQQKPLLGKLSVFSFFKKTCFF